MSIGRSPRVMLLLVAVAVAILTGLQCAKKYPRAEALLLVRSIKKGDVRRVKEVLSRASVNLQALDDHGMAPLHYAVLFGNEQVVRLLLEYGADPDSEGSDGMTPLHFAAHWGRTAIVNLLLAKGGNVACRDSAQLTPLHLACANGHMDTVALLLSEGSTIDTRSLGGDTPLSIAVIRAQRGVVRILLANGAEANIANNMGLTALSIAAYRRHTRDIAEVLIDHGAVPNIHTASILGKTQNISDIIGRTPETVGCKDGMGRGPLYWACMYGRTEAVRLLIAAGADVNHRSVGGTALHIAAREGHQDVIKLLIESGVNTDIRNRDGKTALQVAVWNEHRESAQLLLLKGVELDVLSASGMGILDEVKECARERVDRATQEDRSEGKQATASWRSLIHWAAVNGQTAVVEYLLEEGVDVNIEDAEGRTAIHYAAERGHEQLLRFLMQNRAEVGTVSPPALSWLGRVVGLDLERGGYYVSPAMERYSPLHLAASKGHPGVVRALISRGALVNSKSAVQRWTPLHLACRNGHKRVLELLVAEGADINARSMSGVTPLCEAISRGDEALVQVLVANGANLNSYDAAQGSPMVWALSRGHREIASLIRKNGGRIVLFEDDL